MKAVTQALRVRLSATPAGQWFRSQATRDQRMLVLLALFVALVLLWMTIWLPVQDGLTVARARHGDALEDQRWMISNRDAASRAAGRELSPGQSGQALLSTVASSAGRAGLTLNRFQPEGNDSLAVSLDDVAFDDLVIWLETLAQRQGIRVRQASIDARDTLGRVRARLLLN